MSPAILRVLAAIRRWWHQEILARQAALEDKLDAVLTLAREAQQERERERAATEHLEIGSFVPSDADAARLERQHQTAERRFLSARQPPPPSRPGSGPWVTPSGPESSKPAARSSRGG